MSHNSKTVLQKLAGVALAAKPVPAAKRVLIDWFGVAIAGATRPPATLLRAAMLDPGIALVLPDAKASARTAALINGTAAHTVELDDIFCEALYHPGAPVIAAALATCQAEQVGGETLLRSITAGYEVAGRIGLAMGASHYDFWHSTGTLGAFGAAAAAGVALGLDAGPMSHALATAGTMAAGLQQAFRSEAMSKPLHAGRAAETGVLAALTAKEGVTGAPDLLEGERGFGKAMSRDADWSRAETDRLLIEQTTQKNHAACGHGHAAIDAILALGEKPDDVRAIRIGTYRKAIEIMGNADPKTEFEAKFSLPYCAAAALCVGRVRLSAFDDIHRGDIREVMNRVTLYEDAEAESVYPGRRSAVVEIETSDGKRRSHRAPTRKGDPDLPLSDKELDEKFRELIGDSALLDRLKAIDRLDDVSRLDIPEPAPRGDPPRVGFIGCGEAGTAIADGLRDAGIEQIRGFDPNVKGTVPTLKELAEQSDVIFSTVVASVALDVAKEMGPHLESRHLYVDLNSTSPDVKKEIAGVVGNFVEAAVMGAVPPHRHRVPMLICGPGAKRFEEIMTPYGMRVESLGEEVGRASAVKMFRSVIIKGLEAVLQEALVAADKFGARKRVLNSVEESFPGLDWERVAEYLESRTKLHGPRRAKEMLQVAETLRALGIDPLMSEAAAKRLDPK